MTFEFLGGTMKTAEKFASGRLLRDQDSALRGLVLGVTSALLGGWLALGLYRQGPQEKVIAQTLGDRFQSTFLGSFK